MKAPADRMSAMRGRRRAGHLRELRLIVPDARTAMVRARVAQAIAGLDRDDEAAAMAWLESVSEFDTQHDRTLDDLESS